MRLELSTRTDLALRALRRLHEQAARVPRAVLAADVVTTPDFLARVMAPLVAEDWVTSHPGPGGGYEIAPSALHVSVYDVVSIVEGLPPEDRCVLRNGSCDPTHPCALHEAWTRARKALLDELRGAPAIPRGG